MFRFRKGVVTVSHDLNISANIKSAKVYPQPYEEVLKYLSGHFGDIVVELPSGKAIRLSDVFTDIEVWR